MLNSAELSSFWFVISYSIALAAMVMFWVSFRDFVLKKNYRSLLFGGGLFLISIGNLFLHITDVKTNIYLVFIPFFIGLVAVGFSLIKERWQYLFGLGALLPAVLPKNSPWFMLSVIPMLFISYLAYRNFCFISCDYDKCEKKGIENKEWGAIFFLLAVVVATHINLLNQVYPTLDGLFGIFHVVAELIIIVLIYYHILTCLHFSNKEKILLPTMLGFVAIFSLSGYMISQFSMSFLETKTSQNLSEKSKAVKYIAESSSPKGSLIKDLESRDPKLNDLADKILADTGIRSVFFLGDERVAASPSANGQGRFLGTRISDPNVTDAVLAKGDSYTGKISKGGVIFLASYTPVEDENGQIIGMISTGEPIGDLYQLQQGLIRQIAAAIGIFFLISIFAITYTLPKFGKKKL